MSIINSTASLQTISMIAIWIGAVASFVAVLASLVAGLSAVRASTLAKHEVAAAQEDHRGFTIGLSG